MQVSMPVLACSCLPGEIQGKGVGVALFQFLKKVIEYKCTGLRRGVYAADGKNRPGVMALTVSGREARGYVGVSRCQVGKIDQGQMGTHVYGQDSTHVHTHVYGRCLVFDNLPLSPAKVSA